MSYLSLEVWPNADGRQPEERDTLDIPMDYVRQIPLHIINERDRAPVEEQPRPRVYVPDHRR